ncbi:hypothetical protein N7478_011424 [Penicillium angulare]|uniref:uncharacterized protein n=1 Tax=Penicillium angulare TaxID=116970 RepID=UPI0025415009|nr:uncharacterized protein N7478_011424 [Penicillium angulare]KAJ5263819.1 hypothetical protein N7478_011424 [Penicillium angulare]
MSYLTANDRIRAVEAIINYGFHNPQFIANALKAAGSSGAAQGNKRLALIGDAVLRLVLYELGYEEDRSIGDMTSAQNTRATNENLARIGFSLGLSAFIQLSPSAQGVVPERLMATTIEAIIGAVYLDSGRDIMVVRALIRFMRI